VTEKLTKEGEQALGINEKYGDLIVTLRSEGKTLQQIGNQLGVSRERVRQVLAKYWPGCRPPPSGEEAAKMLGMSYRQFRAAAKAVGVQPINRSPTSIRWAHDVLPLISMAQKPSDCYTCGRPLPSGRRVYCCELCYREGIKRKRRMQRRKESAAVAVALRKGA
jgi:lambda repressor-like predicted transcriptional regulator/predicted nucleic acid-binding Zn ribbon protein